MTGIARTLRQAGVPRPPRPALKIGGDLGGTGAEPVASEVLDETLKRHLATIASIIGCDAIEARAIWVRDGVELKAHAATGAAEGDVDRLRRLPPFGGRKP